MIQSLSRAIPDREVPRSEAAVAAILEKLDSDLTDGNNAVVHCRQGVGRSGLIAARMLASKRLNSGAAIEAVSAAGSTTTPQL